MPANFELVGIEAVVQGMATFTRDANNVNKLLNNINATTSKLASDSSLSWGTVERTSNIAIGAIASGAGIAVTALAAITAATVKIGASFEANVLRAAVATGASAAELTQLGTTVLEVAKRSSLSISDIAEAENTLARSGITLQDIQNGVLKSTVSLAEASGGELGLADASKLVSIGMNAWKLSASQVDDVTASLTAVANSSAVGFGDMFTSLQLVAPAAALLGFSVQDTAAALGLFGNAGIKGTTAGTALKTMFTNLLRPTQAAQDVMTKYNIAAFDAQGRALGLRQVIDELNKAFGDQAIATGKVTEQQRGEALVTLFGTRSVLGAIASTKAGISAFDEFQTKIADTDPNVLAEKLRQTLTKQVDILRNNLEALIIQMSGPLVDALSLGVTNVNNFLRALNPAIPKAFGDALLTIFSGKGFADLGTELQKALGTQFGTTIQNLIGIILSLRNAITTQIVPAFLILYTNLTRGVSVGNSFNDTLSQIAIYVGYVGRVIARTIYTIAEWVGQLKTSAATSEILTNVLRALVILPVAGFVISLGRIALSIGLISANAVLLAIAVALIQDIIKRVGSTWDGTVGGMVKSFQQLTIVEKIFLIALTGLTEYIVGRFIINAIGGAIYQLQNLFSILNYGLTPIAAFVGWIIRATTSAAQFVFTQAVAGLRTLNTALITAGSYLYIMIGRLTAATAAIVQWAASIIVAAARGLAGIVAATIRIIASFVAQGTAAATSATIQAAASARTAAGAALAAAGITAASVAQSTAVVTSTGIVTSSYSRMLTIITGVTTASSRAMVAFTGIVLASSRDIVASIAAIDEAYLAEEATIIVTSPLQIAAPAAQATAVVVAAATIDAADATISASFFSVAAAAIATASSVVASFVVGIVGAVIAFAATISTPILIAIGIIAGIGLAAAVMYLLFKDQFDKIVTTVQIAVKAIGDELAKIVPNVDGMLSGVRSVVDGYLHYFAVGLGAISADAQQKIEGVKATAASSAVTLEQQLAPAVAFLRDTFYSLFGVTGSGFAVMDGQIAQTSLELSNMLALLSYSKAESSQYEYGPGYGQRPRPPYVPETGPAGYTPVTPVFPDTGKGAGAGPSKAAVDNTKELAAAFERILAVLPGNVKALSEFLAGLAHIDGSRFQPMVDALLATKGQLDAINASFGQLLIINQQIQQVQAQIGKIQAIDNAIDLAAKRESLGLTQQQNTLALQALQIQQQLLPIRQAIAAIDKQISDLQRTDLATEQQLLQLQIQALPIQQNIAAIDQQITDAQRENYKNTYDTAVLNRDSLPIRQAIADLETQINRTVDQRGTLLKRQQEILQQQTVDNLTSQLNSTQTQLDAAWKSMNVPQILALEAQKESLTNSVTSAQDQLTSIQDAQKTQAQNEELAQIQLKLQEQDLIDILNSYDDQLTILKNQKDQYDANQAVIIADLQGQKQAQEDLLRPITDHITAINNTKAAQDLQNSLAINGLEQEKQHLEDLAAPMEAQLQAIKDQNDTLQLQVDKINLLAQQQKLQYDAELLDDQTTLANLDSIKTSEQERFDNLVLGFANSIAASGAFTAQEAIEVATRLGYGDAEITNIGQIADAYNITLVQAAENATAAIKLIPTDVTVQIHFAVDSLPPLPSYQYGGTIPGPIGQPQLVVAHGGEHFLGVGNPPPPIFSQSAASRASHTMNVTNNYTYEVNASYAQTQSPATVGLDLRAVIAMSKG